jgi:DNA-binding transcriptional MerR regulator
MPGPPSESKTKALSFSGGVDELAAAVNTWANEAEVFPVSGQAAREVSVRNLRYYRSQALLDGPLEGGGYCPKHFLQVAAIRLLQANGLPLARIRDLLYGRSEEELVAIFHDGVAELHRPPKSPEIIAPGESCQLHGLAEGFALLVPNGSSLSQTQLEAINRILTS